MAITTVKLDRFGPFGDVEFSLCPGVNVFLGANSTGKTFAAKAIYSVVKGLSDGRPPATPREWFRDKLAGVFRPDDGDVRRLISRIQGRSNGRIRVEFDDRSPVRATISPGKQVITSLDYPRGETDPTRPSLELPALFIPSREVLALYEGLVALYDKREISLDETYRDTALALSTPARRGPRPPELRQVAATLEEHLGGKVRLQGPRFYLDGRYGRLEAHLVAEGLRKLASIVHLIANGELDKGGLLLWDEPEANLHPRLAEVVVECLGVLAEGGVQIIVATHDYLLADAISRWVEYRAVVKRKADVRFFQLLRDDDDAVYVETADSFVKLSNNPLLDAFLAHHDREQQLIARQISHTERRSRR